jgi:excinuclease ABC subunit C
MALKKTLRFLRRAFPYYSVKKHPKLKCTYCHLDLCPGPEPDAIEYKKNIKKLILILKGKTTASGGVPQTAGETVLKSLKKEMKQLSKEKEFEKAGKIRDKIHNLQQVMMHTHVIAGSQIIFNSLNKINNWQATEKILKGILDIKKNIARIECYDVSNIQGKQATGSMVVFINNEPDKNQYRKFQIKMENEPNDIAMLKETISRRLQHSEWPYPEIMLIDGGKGQLNAALEIKNSKNYLKNSKIKNLKIISIAKGRQELFIEGKNKPIPLKNLPREIFNLILQLDAEAHRFAITYHKKLRKRNLMP